MTSTQTGWMIFVAAFGMMAGMLAVDVAALKAWTELSTPLFVGTSLGHVGAVIAAFVGGKIMPIDREPTLRTRANDGTKKFS